MRDISKQRDLAYEYSSLLTTNKMGITISLCVLTFSWFVDILQDSSISVVIELIGGIDEAYDILKSCIQSGKHVVTYPF